MDYFHLFITDDIATILTAASISDMFISPILYIATGGYYTCIAISGHAAASYSSSRAYLRINVLCKLYIRSYAQILRIASFKVTGSAHLDQKVHCWTCFRTCLAF
jgi:hypothetical protein